MKNLYKVIGLSLFFGAAVLSVKAQDKPCGTTEFTQKLRAQYPQLVQDFDNYNQDITNASMSGERTTGPVYIVPVVFHVMHLNGPENISDAQIYAQVAKLNTDYRKLNADTSDLFNPFKGLASDVRIEFRLAQLDPNGNCTNGIDRIYTHRTLQADDNTKLNQWPRDKYLNIWVVHDINGSTPTTIILGFAHFPSDVAGPLYPYDGIIAVYNTINGSSRTLTHEIGHYLNLQHTWGSTNDPNVACGDDLVDDTPTTKGHFSTCPLLDAVCSTNPFTLDYKFDSLKTTTGTVDTVDAMTSTGVIVSDLKAVGVGPNTTVNGKLAFDGWDAGAPNGTTSYAALTGSINTSKYYEVTFAPISTNSIKYTGMTFSFSRNATGVRTFAVRSSLDGFTNNIGSGLGGAAYAATAAVAPADAANMSVPTPGVFFVKNDSTKTITGGKITITGAKYTNDTVNPVTFRIYGWNAEDPTGTFELDSVNFLGSSNVVENVQNYMDYSSCTRMFTAHQVLRMRTAIESPVSHRNNLWSAANLAATGVLNPVVCAPHADFYSNKNRVCATNTVRFTKNVLGATPDSVKWTFYGGTPFTSTSMSPVNVVYNTAGIYKVTLTAYTAGGVDSATKVDYIRVDPGYADVDYNGFYSEGFEDPSTFYGIWQVTNYDNNAGQWVRYNSAGYQSSNCVSMRAYGNFRYDIDELVTPSYDFSFTSGNQMTFELSAASSAGAGSDANDTLRVFVSTNCGTSWIQLAAYSDSSLINNGYFANDFTPTSSSNWWLKTINIPATYATSNARFKFQYRTGTASNNIYIDNINITGVVGIDENANSISSVSIYPNPSNQTSTVAYHLDKKANTKIEVMDVLGKSVFVQSNSAQAEGDYKVQISKQNLNLRNGIYFVKFSVEDKSVTKKLIITE